MLTLLAAFFQAAKIDQEQFLKLVFVVVVSKRLFERRIAGVSHGSRVLQTEAVRLTDAL